MLPLRLVFSYGVEWCLRVETESVKRKVYSQKQYGVKIMPENSGKVEISKRKPRRGGVLRRFIIRCKLALALLIGLKIGKFHLIFQLDDVFPFFHHQTDQYTFEQY